MLSIVYHIHRSVSIMLGFYNSALYQISGQCLVFTLKFEEHQKLVRVLRPLIITHSGFPNQMSCCSCSAMAFLLKAPSFLPPLNQKVILQQSLVTCILGFSVLLTRCQIGCPIIITRDFNLCFYCGGGGAVRIGDFGGCVCQIFSTCCANSWCFIAWCKIHAFLMHELLMLLGCFNN